MLQIIEDYKELFLDHKITHKQISRNYDVLYQLQLIKSTIQEWSTEAQNKTYKRQIDHLQLVLFNVLSKINFYLVNVVTNQDEIIDFELYDSLLKKSLYYWNQYFVKIQNSSFDQVSIILFLNELKPYINQIEGLDKLYFEASKIFENTMEHHLYSLFIDENEEDCTSKLSLDVKKSKKHENKVTAINEFKKIINFEENENSLYVNLEQTDTHSKFLDKFYLIEIHEQDGIISHNKVDYELLEDSMIKKVLIIPRDINNYKVICTYESKFLPINCKALADIKYSENGSFDDEHLSESIIKSISRFNSYKIYCKNMKGKL